jgi:hypothetical protein
MAGLDPATHANTGLVEIARMDGIGDLRSSFFPTPRPCLGFAHP